MSVSSALSSFLYGCFYPIGGRHNHRAGAYYHSSHPTSADTLYYNNQGALAGRRMGRSRPLSLQVEFCSVSSSSLSFHAMFFCLLYDVILDNDLLLPYAWKDVFVLFSYASTRTWFMRLRLEMHVQIILSPLHHCPPLLASQL
jgi:hypothetical protein